MDEQMTDPLFTELPGALFLAPFGTKQPDSQVLNGRFVDEWPDPWDRACLTDPDRSQDLHDPEGIAVGELDPVLHVWRFGVDDLGRFERLADPTLVVSVGWESRDAAARAGSACAQMLVDPITGDAVFALSERIGLVRWWTKRADPPRP